MEQLNTAARGARSILITGETGTGKEVLARHIAELSGRSPLVVVNCSAIPEHLFESEFFGHVKGAFTSAHAYRQGKLVQADGGILFLDEVGDMPLSSQAKLLRVLEGHPFTPIGGSTDVHVSVLFLAATNRDLPALVSSGKCRADLYDRLSIFSVHLPPLQDRQEDIPYLARYFLDRANRQYSKGCSFSRRFFAQLMAHHYTGHVRELRNIIDKAVISSPGQGLLRSFDAAPLAPSLPISRDVRRLLRVMAENGWKQYKAAKALGITPAAMSARIRKHGLDYVSLLRAVQAAELPYED
ncbi:MAG: AAA domain-containing protein [Deltaproteobacteria bacterium]|nr:AAA domain-containing protein [Deltaproteobacteria bacterium]